MRTSFQTRFVLYDGGCGICRRALGRLRYFDLFGVTVPYDITRQSDALRARWPGLDFDALLRDMHVITQDGRVYAGFDAYRSLAWVIPLVWPILPLLYLPPVRRWGARIYRRVADNRRRCNVRV